MTLLFALGICLAGGLVIGLVALVLWIAVQQRKAWVAALHQVSSDHGLRVHEGTWLKGATADGRLGDLQVLVDTYTVSTGKSSSTYTRIRAWGDQPAALVIAPEGLVARFGKALGASDLEVGDPAFDDAVILRGEPPARLLSRLDRPARAAIAQAAARGAKLERGTWTLVEGGMIADAGRLSTMVGGVVRAARELARTDIAPADGLWALVERDPVPGVRQRALDLLLHLEPDPRAFEGLLDEPDPRIRLRAARAMSRIEVLAGLLTGPADVRRDAAIALARLGFDTRDVRAALVDALAEPDDDVLDALDAVGTVHEVAPLRQVADRHASIGRVSRGATRAIRSIQGRIAGAEAGSLAVAEVSSGALSEAEARDRGRLAKADRERS